MFRGIIGAMDSPLHSAGFLQLVRWRRKPRWLPVAKSKIFRVPERVAQDPVERSELMRLHANYKTQLRAVRGFLMTETRHREETSTADHLIISPEQMEAEFQQCSQVNDAWNAKIAQIRDQRLQKERAEKRDLIMERLLAKDERSASRRASAEEQVRLAKERSQSLITPENIDQAIEAALADTKDYNYAIDLSGKIYRPEEEDKAQRHS